MTNRPGGETEIGGDHQGFHPTEWSQILRVRDRSIPEAQKALENLCQLYWKPIYFYIRRKGYAVEDAKDLTQAFFAMLVERDLLQNVDPAKGKFRTFLLAVLNHFLCDEFDRRNALKRKPHFEFNRAEETFRPDQSFEHDWAVTVLDRAFQQLRTTAPREAAVVETQLADEKPYRQLAQQFETSENNIKELIYRGRNRLRNMILRELRLTVSKPGEEVDEINDLFRAFSL